MSTIIEYIAQPCKKMPTRMCPIQFEDHCGKDCFRFDFNTDNLEVATVWVSHFKILAAGNTRIDRRYLA